jgi:hypothetical protein
MNYTPVDSAYNIEHVNPNIYRGTIKYSKQCIYCSSQESISLLQDGSFRKCNKCRKNFKAHILTNPIQNYNHSINHLKNPDT